MKKLIIIGAGQHAQVVAEIAEELGYKIIGFLDDNIAENTVISGYKVIGKNEYCLQKKAEFVIAIGNNGVRKEISEKYSSLKYATLIHPSAVVSKHSEVGEGTVVCANAVINTLCKIGGHSIINTSAVIEHGAVIGKYSHIGPTVYITANRELRELTLEKKNV